MLLAFLIVAGSTAKPTPTGWIGITLGVLGIAGLAGFAYVYFRSSVSKAALDNYKAAYESLSASHEALEVRVKTTEDDVAVAKSHAERCEAELAGQRTAYNALVEQVKGTSAIEALGVKLDARFDELVRVTKQASEEANLVQDQVAEALGHFITDLRKKFDLEDMDRRQ